ncbi:hypothetical protein PUNSTDRAFT_142149 [Punctularia strigosozonata HHB-11173 SS5]|uniref:uncharacterized protein n=1 Tax=Punctularia strigosozonata (strain HHB-11173) TaxID=741275 RepID=UPI0004417A91|nr:uncharacterized protein PUNSTDRAFT_142149 [Punctularia strigosozonata HHB-11173 SS5]EIN11944.1 hypothetical protein PUNSTDRAFT_142149 [Punctularia strigosozonata HHB-11173 SS5]
MFRVHGAVFKHNSKSEEFLSQSRRGDVVVMEEFSALDFERFLDVLFTGHSAMTADEWMSVMGVACVLNYGSIRQLAVHELSSIASPVDRILCARNYGIADWLSDAYLPLNPREDPLTLAEGRRLGVDEVICINTLRHQLMKDPSLSSSDVKSLVVGRLSHASKDGLADPQNAAACVEQDTDGDHGTYLGPEDPSPSESENAYPTVVHFTCPHGKAGSFPPPYRRPMLDIPDVNGVSIVKRPSFSETVSDDACHLKCRTLGERRSVCISWHGYDLRVAVFDTLGVLLNGVRTYETSIVLAHADVIVFCDDLVDDEGRIVFQFGKPYIACREDTTFSSTSLTSTGRGPKGKKCRSSSLSSAVEPVEDKALISSFDEAAAASALKLAAWEWCTQNCSGTRVLDSGCEKVRDYALDDLKSRHETASLRLIRNALCNTVPSFLP